jgi:hypothetical protein
MLDVLFCPSMYTGSMLLTCSDNQPTAQWHVVLFQDSNCQNAAVIANDDALVTSWYGGGCYPFASYYTPRQLFSISVDCTSSPWTTIIIVVIVVVIFVLVVVVIKCLCNRMSAQSGFYVNSNASPYANSNTTGSQLAVVVDAKGERPVVAAAATPQWNLNPLHQ